MTIGDVGRRTGIRTSAIRYYERLGVLPKASRRGGRRYYDPSVLDALAIIRFAKYMGFSLAELRLLLGGQQARPRPERWREIARGRLAELDVVIARAQDVRRLLDETLRHQCPKLVERGQALLGESVATTAD